MLPYLEIPAKSVERGVVIWLHGLGAEGSDLEPVAQMLGMPELRHILPDAPVRPVTINGGMVMHAWYDIASADISGEQEDRPAMIASAEAVAALAASRVKPGTPLLVIGFSQGGVIALILGLRLLRDAAGIGVLSSYMPRFLQGESWFKPALFMAHGDQDSVILPVRGRASRDRLVSAGASVIWREYPMAHAICQEEIQDLAKWARDALGL
ncbi:MAG TPA: carboxylesterase [Thiobacillaceae bacterium]|nr:carboxylesterase [Thiobacillaceae bacterium]